MYNEKVDHLTPILRSENMSKIRSKHTSPEVSVRKFLSSKGLRYRLHEKSLPGKPDVVFKANKTVIFINGCFWHHHKDCRRSTIPKSNQEYWIPKLERNINNQKNDIKMLRKLSWRIFIIWECEANNERKLEDLLKRLNEKESRF